MKEQKMKMRFLIFTLLTVSACGGAKNLDARSATKSDSSTSRNDKAAAGWNPSIFYVATKGAADNIERSLETMENLLSDGKGCGSFVRGDIDGAKNQLDIIKTWFAGNPEVGYLRDLGDAFYNIERIFVNYDYRLLSNPLCDEPIVHTAIYIKRYAREGFSVSTYKNTPQNLLIYYSCMTRRFESNVFKINSKEFKKHMHQLDHFKSKVKKDAVDQCQSSCELVECAWLSVYVNNIIDIH